MTRSRENAIGVFDSGFGGLTVVRAISEALPAERIVYLGDTARVPYGTKSASTVRRYAVSCAEKLTEYNIKVLVVACNTASAVALDSLRVEFDVPVVGVIGPGARAAARQTRGGRVGVLATAGTVHSGAYRQKLAAESTRVELFQQAAPLLVPLVEEGWLDGDVPRLATQRYLRELLAHRVDTLVLGCTHYPVLAPLILSELAMLHPEPIAVVDTPKEVARELDALLVERELQAPVRRGDIRMLVTDLPEAFADLAVRFLGPKGAGITVKQVDLST